MRNDDATTPNQELSTVDASLTEAPRTLESQGLKAMDALHLASATEGGCDYLLTTDKQILRKMKNDKRLKVLDPVEFIRETEAIGE